MSKPRGADLGTLGLLAVMHGLLVVNVAVYVTAPVALPVHMFVSALAVHLAFTVWHEAAHLNVSSQKWVNHLVGVLGMIPYMTPYFIQRWVHLRHHSRLNEPDDPNLIYATGSFRTILFRYPRAVAYGREVMRNDPRSRPEQLADICWVVTLVSIYASAWWFGYLFDIVMLWLIPAVAAKLVMDWYINYIPHVGLPPHRYLGTRIFDVAWLTPLVLGHNYHAIHHLWPDVPWHRYRSVFVEKLDYLVSHGVPIETRVRGVLANAQSAPDSSPSAG